ncbi:glutathione S-transferase [Penicillium subrubescens]|uniref:glutathione S-transferase n=1 Tax=Penicillium subrubescens TaxID=1316194 RepID=UPI0025458698|nr:glutathione S-transferase [Penicillium subrubescens]KAJ5884020.1 glutathione S-transferase [Penicillium subrubescens]
MGHGEKDEELVSSYETQIRQCFDYYEALLATQTNLAGNNYTVVDIFHLPWIAFLEKLGMWHEV